MRARLSRTALSSSITRMRGTGLSVRQRGDDTRMVRRSDVRIAGVVAAAMVMGACVAAPGRTITPVPVPRVHALKVRVQVKEGAALVVREVALEDYVTAAALSEVHPDAADGDAAEKMFEVQTVLARSYARTNLGRHGKDGFDFCSTTHCQLYQPERLASSRW